MSEGPTGDKPRQFNVVVSQHAGLINGGKTFQLTMIVHRSFRQTEDWETIVWDHCLSLAHAAGHIPVGPVVITSADNNREQDQGNTMAFLMGLQQPLMDVVAEVEIATSAADPVAYANESLARIEAEKRAEQEYADQVHDLDAELAKLLAEEGGLE